MTVLVLGNGQAAGAQGTEGGSSVLAGDGPARELAATTEREGSWNAADHNTARITAVGRRLPVSCAWCHPVCVPTQQRNQRCCCRGDRNTHAPRH